MRTSATASFMSLWNLLNGKRGYGWDENPLVWVYEFRVTALKIIGVEDTHA